MGQACSSQTPKQVDETCKTPREVKTAAAAVPTVVHVEAAAAVPAHQDPQSTAVTAATATAPQHDAPQAPEPKPFVDTEPLHKPLEETNLADQEQCAAAHPDSSDDHAHAGHAQHSLTEDSAAHSTPAETELHAGLQDSAQHAQQGAPTAAGSAGDHTQAMQEQEEGVAGGPTMPEEGTPVEPRSRLTTVDGVTTHQSTCSSFSASRQHSGLTEAAAPDALHDEVSESALKAPSVDASAPASRPASATQLLHPEHSKPSRAGSGALQAEHSKGSSHSGSSSSSSHGSEKESPKEEEALPVKEHSTKGSSQEEEHDVPHDQHASAEDSAAGEEHSPAGEEHDPAAEEHGPAAKEEHHSSAGHDAAVAAEREASWHSTDHHEEHTHHEGHGADGGDGHGAEQQHCEETAATGEGVEHGEAKHGGEYEETAVAGPEKEGHVGHKESHSTE